MTDATADSSSIFTRKPRKGYPAQKSTENEKRTKGRGEIYYLPLYKAALQGKWEDAEKIIKDDKNAMVAEVSSAKETALHIAASTGRRSIKFVERLVDSMDKDLLGQPDKDGDTPLHYAALVGNTEAATILVEKNPALLHKTNNNGLTPLHAAVMSGQEKIVCDILKMTSVEDPCFTGQAGVKLLNLLITADFYEIAFQLLKRNPSLALKTDKEGLTALRKLALKPGAFKSRSQKGNCWSLFNHCCSHNSACRSSYPQGGDVENAIGSSEKGLTSPTIVKKMSKHTQALKLLRLLIDETLKVDNASKVRRLLLPPVRLAARWGIHEFVAEVIKAYPQSLWLLDENGMSYFHLAVKYRHENIFGLLCHQMSSRKHFITTSLDGFGNNLLHLAGELQPSDKVSGAALQMQRELQWFQEVEKVVQPSYKEMKNRKGKTPRMVFTEEHKDLLKQGEKWMKGTASSCTVVAALVVTVAFAAAFTVPGGNTSDQGIPIYLNEAAFLIFAISNAFALFSSSTSLLMFLGILTSRYSEYDFLKALPMRMSIGLISLFFSIVSMLVAFGSSLQIVLSHRVNWIWVPISLLACVPVTLFAILQFPLLVEIVSSTFGPGIFRKRNDEIIM
ncbi:ankyrin repeat-containing protein At5g02620-like [Hevea brasiliensis]|uniref:ankyrin repeat-containing protein At5g02620-like n=1 Tax=Hevea brasiliensis TaxID=3981 RepID=UPI0025D5C0BC|nr:ankyrin repeat-containing protein At5g02620-like [Hevea brasiliensis]